MKSIAAKLGLAAEASEDAILTEVTRLQNRITTLEPLDEENKTLKNRVNAIDDAQCEILLDLHGVKEEKLRNRLKPVLVGMKNREERIAALVDFGHKAIEPGKADKGAQTRVLNRADGKTASAEVPADEKELAAKAEAEINDYKIRNRCSYADARNSVRSAKPELFGLTKS